MSIKSRNKASLMSVSVALIALNVVTMPNAMANAEGNLAGEVRYSWWGGPQRNEKTYQVIDLFEAKNPGVSLVQEPSDWSGYWQKLNVQASGGNLPCVVQMQNRWLANYDDPSILLPLDDLVADNKIDLTGVPEALINSGRGGDGNLYMIPTGVFYFVILMNQTMAEAAGVPLPDQENYTWDDYAEYLKAVAAKLPDGVAASGGMASMPEAFGTFVQSYGYPVFENGQAGFDEAIVQEWFELWTDLREAGATLSPDQMVEDRGDTIEESGIANNRILMQPRPANRLDAHQNVIDKVAPGNNIDIFVYPVGPDGAGEDVGTNGISIAANCEGGDRDIATSYLNFFLQNEEAATIYSSDNGVVAVDRFQDAQYNDPNATSGQREQIDALRIVSQRAKPIFYPTGGFAAVRDALQSSYERVAFGQMTPEDAAKLMVREINRNLQ